MQDVPGFVRQNGFAFRDYLDERFEAVLDAEHCVRLNYEAFLFGDPRALFEAEPERYRLPGWKM